MFEKLSASLFALFFALFALSTGVAMTSTAHASTMPDRSTVEDHSAHIGFSNDTSRNNYSSELAVISHDANSTCAAMCQSNNTSRLVELLSISEKEDLDEPFNEVTQQNVCLSASNDPEPVYKDYERKVPLYLENCLLRI